MPKKDLRSNRLGFMPSNQTLSPSWWVVLPLHLVLLAQQVRILPPPPTEIRSRKRRKAFVRSVSVVARNDVTSRLVPVSLKNDGDSMKQRWRRIGSRKGQAGLPYGWYMPQGGYGYSGRGGSGGGALTR